MVLGLVRGVGAGDVPRQHALERRGVRGLHDRPLPDPPSGVEARSGDVAGVAAELEGRGHRRVWIEGGGRVIRSMVALGKLDVLELALIPTVLGDGIPLFPQGTGELRLRLAKCEAKAKGALHLVSERAA